MIVLALRAFLILVASSVAITVYFMRSAENDALKVNDGTPGTIMRTIGQERPAIPVSYGAQRRIIVPCITVFASDVFLLQSKATKESALVECRRRAEGVLARSSRHPEALLLGAIIAHQEGALDAAAALVEASRAQAPKDLWLAQHRTSLILKLRRSSETAAVSPTDELATLMASRRGLDFVARLFVSTPDLREEFLSAGVLADEEARARFIAAAERLTR